MDALRDPQEQHGMRVTRQGRAYVDAKTISRIGNISETSAQAYACYLRHTVQAAATSEWVGWVQNDSNTPFVVSKIILSGGDVSATPDDTFKHELFFAVASEYTSGGDAFTPLNLNRSSGKQASLTVYQNDSNNLTIAASVNNSREFADFRTSSGGGAHVFETNDSIILGNNDAIAVKCEGSAIGGKVRATIWGYFKEVEFNKDL